MDGRQLFQLVRSSNDGHQSEVVENDGRRGGGTVYGYPELGSGKTRVIGDTVSDDSSIVPNSLVTKRPNGRLLGI